MRPARIIPLPSLWPGRPPDAPAHSLLSSQDLRLTPALLGAMLSLLGAMLSLLGVMLSLLGAGCSQDRGRMPVARLSIEPRYVPAGQTIEVLLDGRRSCDEIDHPETCDKSVEGTTGPPQSCPGGVTFHWDLDAPYELIPGEGGAESPSLRIRITPDRPVTVTLTVTDCEENHATAHSRIGIILPYPESPPDAGTP